MTEPQKRISARSTADPGQSHPGGPQGLVLGRILWRHRYLVVLGALLPTLLVGLALYLLPTVYRTTLVYQRPLTASAYRVLLSRFYSPENLGKIVVRLRADGIDDYAAQLEQAQTQEALEDLVRFEVFPAHPTSLQTLDEDMAELLSSFQAQLLCVEMTGASKDDLSTISDVIAANIENVLPLYDVRGDLRESIRTVRKRITAILDNRAAPAADLTREQALLALNTRLLEEIEKGLATDYTVQQYVDFLNGQLAACEKEEMQTYLQAYIGKTKNLTYAGNRAVERPLVVAVSKHIVPGSVLAFIVSLMAVTFVAVALEQRRERLRSAPRRSGPAERLP